MKRLLCIIACAFGFSMLPGNTQSAAHDQNQVFVGTWQAALKVGNGMELPLVFHFSKANNKYQATLDSPMQGKLGMPVDAVYIDGGGKIRADLAKLKASFIGVLDKSGKTIDGTWTQAGNSLPLKLQLIGHYHGPNRPQEPKGPFPYNAESVQFGQESVALSGTLTVPKGEGPFPAIVLIHGSGPHDRDETIFSHKPFLLLADYLTRRGIAVLRYDKRGCFKSSGDYKTATTADFADDAQKAIEFLKIRPEIDSQKIGLLGHSEGGIVAPMVAARSEDVHFIVMMAGSILPGEQILISQLQALGAGQGQNQAELDKELDLAKRTYAILKTEPDDSQAIEKIKAMRKRSNAPEYQLTGDARNKEERELEAGLKTMASPWYRFFISYDPRPLLTKVHCPVLALNGDRDTQVIANTNLAAIKTALNTAGNQVSQETTMPGLNHLFQTSKTGLPSEYASIEETIAPLALKTIGDWITAQVKADKSQADTALKGGVAHDQLVPGLPLQYQAGTPFNQDKLQTVTADNNWFAIPSWFAGTWHSDGKTIDAIENCKTGTSQSPHITMRESIDVVHGHQRDKTGQVWEFIGVPRWQKAIHSDSVAFLRAMKEDVLQNEPSQVVLKVLNNQILVDEQKQIIVASHQVQQISIYTPLEEGVVKVEASLKTFDAGGSPVLRQSCSAQLKRTAPYADVDSLDGRDLKQLFVDFLQKTGRKNLLPGD